MAKLFKQLFAAQVRIEIVADSKQEAIDWRNYFYNWGAIQIAAGNELDVEMTLNEQELTEMDEMRDGVHFSFYANKQKVIQAFQSSLEAQTDWEAVSARGGKRGRRIKHSEIERAAIDRFEAIPGNY